MEQTQKLKAGQVGNSDPQTFLRNLRLEIRVSPDEWSQIQQNRQRNGFANMAQFVRAQALASRCAESPNVQSKAFMSCAYQLNRIGVNINQIARHLNRGTPADDEIRLVLMQIQEQAQELVQQAKTGGTR